MPNDDVKNLPPEERIKKLKELEQKRKKEIEEAQKIIKESEKELTERRKWKDKVPIPEVAKEDLEGLSETAREILKVQKGVKEKVERAAEESASASEGGGTSGEGKEKGKDQRTEKSKSLEETVAREKVTMKGENVVYGIPFRGPTPQQLLNAEYTVALSQRPAENLYQEVRAVTQRATEKGYFNQDEQRQVAYWTSAMERKLQDVEEGKYAMSTEEVARATSLIEEARGKMVGAYKGDRVERKGHDWYKSG